MDINEAAKAYAAAQTETASTWSAVEQARDYLVAMIQTHANARTNEELARENVLIAASAG